MLVAVPAIAPDPHGERHDEAGDRIDDHHRSDEARRVFDLRENHRQVSRCDRPDQTRSDGSSREN
jgi:hypothetical protein